MIDLNIKQESDLISERSSLIARLIICSIRAELGNRNESSWLNRNAPLNIHIRYDYYICQQNDNDSSQLTFQKSSRSHTTIKRASVSFSWIALQNTCIISWSRNHHHQQQIYGPYEHITISQKKYVTGKFKDKRERRNKTRQFFCQSLWLIFT